VALPAQTTREAVVCQTDDRLASFCLDILENSAFSEFEEDIFQNWQQVVTTTLFVVLSSVFKGDGWGRCSAALPFQITRLETP